MPAVVTVSAIRSHNLFASQGQNYMCVTNCISTCHVPKPKAPCIERFKGGKKFHSRKKFKLRQA